MGSSASSVPRGQTNPLSTSGGYARNPTMAYLRHQNPPHPFHPPILVRNGSVLYPQSVRFVGGPVHQMPATSGQHPPLLLPLQRTNSWNESRDVTYCRILAAEEFLARMFEQDQLVRTLSQSNDREETRPRIVTVLGLRGHLHGELVRIQNMLAENDPELKNISSFEVSHSVVIERLREIRDEARRQRDSQVSSSEGATGRLNRKPSGVDASDQTDGLRTVEQGIGTDSTLRVSEASGVQFEDSEFGAETKSVATGLDDHETDIRLRDIATETDIQNLHKQEELGLAEKFAAVIAGGSKRLTTDEVNIVLSDHSKSVQNLKRRHEQDRKELLRRLELKRNALEKKVESEGHGGIDGVRDMEGTDEARERDREASMGEDSHQNKENNRKAGSNPSLSEIERTLEEMRCRGELSDEAVSSILRQHKARLNESGQNPSRSNTQNDRNKNSSSMEDAVSRLVHDTQLQKEEIQRQKINQKELIDRKLREKLNK